MIQNCLSFKLALDLTFISEIIFTRNVDSQFSFDIIHITKFYIINVHLYVFMLKPVHNLLV